MTWFFPLKNYQHQIPQDEHPGAFGAVRKFDVHTGVDLYCPEGTPIFAVEDGRVITIEIFTGPRAESPWWYETLAILVEGESGVVCYGEVENKWIPKLTDRQGKRYGMTSNRIKSYQKQNPDQVGAPYLVEGDIVNRGDLLTWSKQVLKKDKGKPMCMLHFELYQHGTDETVWWKRDEPKPENLLDPTLKLIATLNHI